MQAVEGLTIRVCVFFFFLGEECKHEGVLRTTMHQATFPQRKGCKQTVCQLVKREIFRLKANLFVNL